MHTSSFAPAPSSQLERYCWRFAGARRPPLRIPSESPCATSRRLQAPRAQPTPTRTAVWLRECSGFTSPPPVRSIVSMKRRWRRRRRPWDTPPRSTSRIAKRRGWPPTWPCETGSLCAAGGRKRTRSSHWRPRCWPSRAGCRSPRRASRSLEAISLTLRGNWLCASTAF